MTVAPTTLVASPRRPGDPASPMPWRQALSLMTQLPSLWGAVGSVILGLASAAAAAIAGTSAQGQERSRASDLLVPLVIVIGVQSLGFVARGIAEAYRLIRSTIRAERIADAEADAKGLLGIKAELAEALKQVAERDRRIEEMRRDHEARLAERDATNLHQAGTIAVLREQVRAQDARQADLANQVASMAESMAGLQAETTRTREAVEETKAAVVPPSPTPDAADIK